MPAAPPRSTYSGGQTLAGPRASETPLEPGAVFHGRYRIEDVLGRGGMGVVYRAHDDLTGDRVVLKVILPSLVSSEDLSKRFLREGKLARDLRHSNIVSVYDVSCADGTFYISMELLEGTSLRKYLFANLRSRREVPLAEACRIVRGILAGLGAAHDAGVIHRDLKPENVMLLGDPASDGPRVKLLDFGIARALRSHEGLTVAGAAMGTPIYMAPEQEIGADTAGPEADLYSVAVIFYEVLLGIPPRGRWELPGKVRLDLPAGLDPFFEKALHSHPSRRLGTVAEFVAAMEKAAGTLKAVTPPLVEPATGTAMLFEPPPVEPVTQARLAGPVLGESRSWTSAGSGIELLYVRAGKFRMGSERGDGDEKPVHEVGITLPFYLGKTEVTQGQWKVVMGSDPSHFKGANRPVEQVSWEDARSFCARLTELERKDGKIEKGWEYRLPTEAEWEYACRAGTTTEYSFGASDRDLSDYGWFKLNSGAQTHEVGQKKANPWGFHDMHGNVWEWCLDVYDKGYYGGSPLTDPLNSGCGPYRVGRGGSWFGVSRGCRSADRGRGVPAVQGDGLGFRVALAPSSRQVK
jgi:formylglycine-generating enzyme required for sulfatase activity/tRNA A-37 threonylcarbamoyl transferase component Bud32